MYNFSSASLEFQKNKLQAYSRAHTYDMWVSVIFEIKVLTSIQHIVSWHPASGNFFRLLGLKPDNDSSTGIQRKSIIFSAEQ